MSEQLKLQECDVCSEQLGENYSVLSVVEERENRYYYCSPACAFSHFIVNFMLMPNNALMMRDILAKAGLRVIDKKKKGKNASSTKS